MIRFHTVFHRDGTVTYWDVYRQQWSRHADPARISAESLATLPESERTRILLMRRQRWRPVVEVRA